MGLVTQFRREYELKKEMVKTCLSTLRDMDDGKDIDVSKNVGLQEQLAENNKNMAANENKQKQHIINILRLERERKECKEALDYITKANEEVKSQINKLQVLIR